MPGGYDERTSKENELASQREADSLPIQISSTESPVLGKESQKFTIPTPLEVELPARPAFGIAFDPSGDVLYIAAGMNVLALKHPTLDVKYGFKCHNGDINGLAIDGARARIATAAADEAVRVWSLDDWSRVKMNASALQRDRELPSPAMPSRVLEIDGQNGVVCCVAFSPSTNVVATCSTDSTVAVWNSDDGDQIYRFDEHEGAVLSLDFSRSGRWLATAGSDSTIRVWDVNSGALAYELSGHVGYVNQVKFAGDDILVSGGDDSTARIWSLDGEDYRSLISVHPDHVDAIAIDFKNDRALSLCADGLIQLHSLNEFRTVGEVRLRVSYAEAAAFSPCGEYVAICNNYGDLYLCDLGQMKLLDQE